MILEIWNELGSVPVWKENLTNLQSGVEIIFNNNLKILTAIEFTFDFVHFILDTMSVHLEAVK